MELETQTYLIDRGSEQNMGASMQACIDSQHPRGP